jgi:hypothetical protein
MCERPELTRARASSLEATERSLDFTVGRELAAFRLGETFQHIRKVRRINFFGFIGNLRTATPASSQQSFGRRRIRPPLPRGERSSRIVRCEAGEGAWSIDGA